MAKDNKKHIGKISIVAILVAVLIAGLFIFPSGNNKTIGSVSASEIIPQGTPKVYGEEIGISYDEVSPEKPNLADATIEKLSKYDRKITLKGNKKQRYIDIASQISCEYCCGAKSIIRSDGSAACGCAHSYAMRGLAKYLIKNHGDDLSDEEILSEIGKWKVLFFPGIHEKKAKVLESQGINSENYINLASNLYRGAEQQASSGSSGGMVGGC